MKALEEYLNDPNFEQNRIEYKTTKALADKNEKEGKKAPNATADKEKRKLQLRFLSLPF